MDTNPLQRYFTVAQISEYLRPVNQQEVDWFLRAAQGRTKAERERFIRDMARMKKNILRMAQAQNN